MAHSDLYQIAPSPNRTIGCQDLLKDGACIHSGWLRRQSLRNKLKIFSWPQVYVVIAGGCVYCFKNETSTRQASAFSLYGYDRVFRAGEITEREATWTFKLVHVNPEFRSYLFSSSSEREMLLWMKLFKQEMLRANGKLTRTQGDGFDSAMYQDAGSYDSGGSIKSLDYAAVEENIYEDSSLFTLPQDYNNKKEEDASDDEMDILVMVRPDLQERPPLPPPVPFRPPKNLATTATKDSTTDAVMAELQQKSKAKDQYYTAPPSKERVQTSKKTEEPTVDRDSKPSSLRKRGDPDGSSLKKNEQEEQLDAREFWSSIFFHGGKESAGEIIRQLEDEGVYLVRVNEDKSMVLHVYAKNQSRKFQIFKLADNTYTLKKDSGDNFKRVEELVFHYYSNPLPNVDVCLTECYVHHPQFDKVTLP